MHALTRDLFEEAPVASLPAYLEAFEAWLAVRERCGSIREPSSVAVYRSMWWALAAWCTGRQLPPDQLGPEHFEAISARAAAPTT